MLTDVTPAESNDYYVHTTEEPALSFWSCMAFPGTRPGWTHSAVDSLEVWFRHGCYMGALPGHLTSMTWSPNINDNAKLPCRCAQWSCRVVAALVRSLSGVAAAPSAPWAACRFSPLGAGQGP